MVAIESVQNRNFSGNTEKSSQKFHDPTAKPKVIYTDKSFEFGKSCEELSWNCCTSTPHRSETNGIPERAVRRIKELLQCGCTLAWMNSDGLIPWNVTVICKTFKTSRRTGKHLRSGVLENPDGTTIPFGSIIEYHRIFAKDQSRFHQFCEKVLPRIFLGYVLFAGGIWKETSWSRTSWKSWMRQKSMLGDSMRRRVIIPKNGKTCSSGRRWNS